MSRLQCQVATMLLVIASLALPRLAHAQVESPKHDFRAAWIATVTNLDWPQRGASTESQKQSLIDILDGLKSVGMNAVIFQVRPEQDALYASETEPWSYWLTGQQGRAPEPFYDPLEFAIEEAHRRGMELHAWFNPYRAERSIGGYTLDERHIAVRHPEWTFTVGDYRQLDPGLPEVRDYVVETIMDVVRRYDIDGVHFDDYFYPYPPNTISNQDAETFAEHDRGFTSVGDWRRDNVDLLVEMLHDSLQAVRPEIKFGISPFGIWKNGVPTGITGMDAYNVIFADALAWLENQWLDYITPQLYWKFGGGQDYERLANWWEEQRNERHFYPGIGAYKSDGATFWNPDDYAADEVPRQVRFNLAHDGIRGSVIFRSSNLTRFPSKGLADSLRQNIFVHNALTPPMPWKDMTAPPAPQDLGFRWTEDDTTRVEISWEAPATGSGDAVPRRYVIYRVQSDTEPDPAEVLLDPANLILVTGETRVHDRPRAGSTYYYVTSLSMNSIESVGGGVIQLEGRAVSAEREVPVAFALSQNYPNPFNPTTKIEYAVERAGPVSLRVYDMLGREVATLQDGPMTTGAYVARFDAGDLASGTYVYVLETEDLRMSRSMVLLK